jgi:hypothetical protein
MSTEEYDKLLPLLDHDKHPSHRDNIVQMLTLMKSENESRTRSTMTIYGSGIITMGGIDRTLHSLRIQQTTVGKLTTYSINMCVSKSANNDAYCTNLKSLEEVADKILEWINIGQCNECGLGWGKHACSAVPLAILSHSQRVVCAICQEKSLGTTKLSCGHAYHFTCLAQLQKAFCPVCRRGFTECEMRTFDLGDDDDDYEDTDMDED